MVDGVIVVIGCYGNMLLLMMMWLMWCGVFGNIVPKMRGLRGCVEFCAVGEAGRGDGG